VKTFVDKPPASIHDQGQMVKDFLCDLFDQMQEHQLWKDSSEEELDHVLEGLEKYTMTKLFE
jgi:hypothetical protein